LLAISVFAISFYTVFDKTLLGLLSTKENVAFYEYSNKIVNIPKAFISVIGTVMYPRSCDMIKNNNISGQKFYFKTSIIIVFYICFSSIFGFLSVGEEFATLYYGNDFSITGKLIISMSPLIFIVGFGEILRMQYLIPSGKDNLYVSSVILSALINICISIILIPILGINGVIIGTVIAESFGLIFQIVVSKDYIDFKFVFKNIMSFVAIGLIMYIFLVQIKDIFEISVIWLIFVISLGIVIYSLLTALYLAFCERGIVIKLINSMKKGKDY
jgi:O-antigen/teichoic acid export membrane protein